MKVKKIWNFGKMALKPSINPWLACFINQKGKTRTLETYGLAGMMTIETIPRWL